MGSNAIQAALIFFYVAYLVATVQGVEVNVKTSGAKGDGDCDDTAAFKKAWDEVCKATEPSTLKVPEGKYMLGQIGFLGPCKSAVTFDAAEGAKFIAPTDLSQFKTKDGWILFSMIKDFTLSGGTYNGQGSAAWKINKCKENMNAPLCKNLPINMNLGTLTNSVVKGIKSVDSKFFHMNVIQCKNLTLNKIKIRAPADSANTDGIHIGRSEGVTVDDAEIKTGDDCISFGDGAKKVTIENVKCGPGHGIAIGSLGRYPNEQPVEDVCIKNCKLTNTMFGVRIKTWPASPEGVATGMHFEDLKMVNVSTPILIDQQYCPWNQCKAGVPSKVKISDVSFKDIKGTSATKVAVKLLCSPGVPCEKVEMSGVNLEYHGTNGSAISECCNVKPTLSGKNVPPICDDVKASA
ncbi:PREDICTED: exopolygalacturonase-like [Ipomoea nil]|uniref:exopolygalacturonase-like n=1 Tax=Ipomoea nil TaxID=35883 RepID=UPI000900BB47|nr:PREDICTED: exopolygalacturonase-like [Ipomoea nil]XP_019197956.1 PREDICTED: exopolygalacturonase-like [Ipomoea nil]